MYIPPPTNTASANANSGAAIDSFPKIKGALRILVDELRSACYRGMENAVPMVEDVATSTTQYDDETGASRASTLAFVYDGTNYPTNYPEQSRANANLYRDDAGDENNTPPPPAPNEIVLCVMISTNYGYVLTVRHGGNSDFIERAIVTNASDIMDSVIHETGALFT